MQGMVMAVAPAQQAYSTQATYAQPGVYMQQQGQQAGQGSAGGASYSAYAATYPPPAY